MMTTVLRAGLTAVLILGAAMSGARGDQPRPAPPGPEAGPPGTCYLSPGRVNGREAFRTVAGTPGTYRLAERPLPDAADYPYLNALKVPSDFAADDTPAWYDAARALRRADCGEDRDAPMNGCFLIGAKDDFAAADGVEYRLAPGQKLVIVSLHAAAVVVWKKGPGGYGPEPAPVGREGCR